MMPHEAFLRELYALCQNHGVHLQEADDKLIVVPNDVDMDLESNDGQLHADRFVYFSMIGDGSMRCVPARRAEHLGILEPDRDAAPLYLPRPQ